MLGAIDESWLLETLAGLIAIPSWGGRERPAQEYMAAMMNELGMDVDVWEIDEAALGRHPDYTTVRTTRRRSSGRTLSAWSGGPAGGMGDVRWC